MKFEIRLNEAEKEKAAETEMLDPGCEVAIDIGQVLAANQALLKNMARKMETLENKLTAMENAYREQLLLQRQNYMNCALLEAPRQEIKAWQSRAPRLDDGYFAKFSVFDRIFRPWMMRRNSDVS
jgi:hypothetical protein